MARGKKIDRWRWIPSAEAYAACRTKTANAAAYTWSLKSNLRGPEQPYQVGCPDGLRRRSRRRTGQVE